MRHPGIQSIQIIFNMFRCVGILARVPLASGLLTGKLNPTSTFPPDDHRTFNREGQAFDQGETFSGVPYDVGLAAVERLRSLVPQGATLAQLALRWILMFDAVTCTIPGARNDAQARANARAVDLSPLDDKTMTKVREVYDEYIRPHVHHRW